MIRTIAHLNNRNVGGSALKVYVSVDMEGLAGIVSREQVIPGERLYDEGRRLLTNEVNVIVQSLVDAGADHILVKDAHYAGMNLHVAEMHPAARYCLGTGHGVNRFAGVDVSFNAAMLIGYHARSGTLGAIRDHTITSTSWQRVVLNGRDIGEIGLDALRFGLFGVPVVLVTGDDKTCAEARMELGDTVVVYETKRGIERHYGVIKAPKAVYAEYPQVIRRALAACGKCAPYSLPSPYELTIRYASTDLVDALHLDGRRDHRVDGQTVVYTDTDLERLLNRVV